jgi:MFS family permease
VQLGSPLSLRKMAFIAGSSILIGAYDQAAIGVDLSTITRLYHLGTGEVALISSVAVVGMVIGGLVSGLIADHFGRRKMLLIDLALLVIGSLGAAAATGYFELVFFRFLGGLSVGAGYTIAFVYLAEIAPSSIRGRWMAATLWGANLGMLLAYGTGALVIGQPWGWRLVFGLGALFAAPLLLARRLLPETEPFKSLQSKQVSSVSDLIKSGFAGIDRNAVKSMSAWFLYQTSDQGVAVLLPLIFEVILLKSAVGGSSLALLTKALTIPASFVTVFVIDRIGRRRLQLLGFGVRSLMFALLALVLLVVSKPAALLVVVLMALAIAAGSMGPDKTTVIVPAENCEAPVRGTNQGIAQVAGRLGGIVGPVVFVFLDGGLGIWAGVAFFALTSGLGWIVSRGLFDATGMNIN